MKQILTSLWVVALAAPAFGQTPVFGVSISPELAYRLPEGYQGKINKQFIDTTTSDDATNQVFAAAQNATFYSFDDEFSEIVGDSPTITTLYASNSTFVYANEGGAWLPDLNQMYFTGSGSDPLPYYVLHFDDLSISRPKVYISGFGLKSVSVAPGIYAIDAKTGQSTVVLNTYQGVHLNSLDDLAWVRANASAGSTSCTRAGEDHLFFSSLDMSPAGHTDYTDAVLPNSIMRFSPATNSLQAVVARADILAPNGVASDPTSRYLYLTDVSMTSIAGPGSNNSGSIAVYKYDLDADCFPVNKRLFAMPRSGYADGIKIDNYGRVWTAEFNGVVVRNPLGKELGVFNAEQLIDPDFYPISNFGLAGDKLVVLSGNKIHILQLGQNVTDPVQKQ
ncbi:hypothetical protein GQ53DRAFT_861884 [Thozetella sp. PMI_491]|nr:hypothetical protein GQ53DRAFT_861884 [Thozetella sp. PMI_491]